MHVDSGMNSPVYKKREGSPPGLNTPVKRSRSTDDSQVVCFLHLISTIIIEYVIDPVTGPCLYLAKYIEL